MAGPDNIRVKRKILEPVEAGESKRTKTTDAPIKGAGKIAKIYLRNFFCHEKLEINFNSSVNFIVGKNGSGKSAILAALTVGLGARASITRRGESHKSMIKTGEQSATIEITLTNTGPGAYKPDIYGDSIKVIRTISLSSSSSYTIKNSSGNTISKKKTDLDQIISYLKIQVENPVSVLNQDSAKDFLLQATPSKKYELFMKATQLESIRNNYCEALATSCSSREKLESTAEQMQEEKQQMEHLEQSISRLDSVDQDQVHLGLLESELLWSIALKEENKLKSLESDLAKAEGILASLANNEETEGVRINEINIKIEQLLAQMKKVEEKIVEARDKARQMREAHETAQDKFSAQRSKIKTCRNKIKKNENSIRELSNEVTRVVEGTGEVAEQRNQLMEHRKRVQEEYDMVEASLMSRKVEVINLENTRNQFNQEFHESNQEYENTNRNMMGLKNQLRSCEQQRGNALAVWGPQMPRLIKRINEEVSRGKIQVQPIGPVGAYIKMRDSEWTPAVEKLLGKGTFQTICVDNNSDAQVVKALMEEVYGKNTPRIYCSKFYQHVHDVTNTCAQSPNYPNLLDTMEINNINITNYLIDNHGVEQILLIPTSKECADILDHIQNVPRNCAKAITKTGDTFYPQPHYRSYGGKVNPRQWLQVSATEKIQSLQSEIKNLENELQRIQNNSRQVRQRLDAVHNQCSGMTQEIIKLKSLQTQLKKKIETLNDEINEFVDKNENIEVWQDEIIQLQGKVAQDKELDTQLLKELKNFEIQVSEIQRLCNEQQTKIKTLELEIQPIKNEIKQLDDEKIELDVNSRQATKRAANARNVVQAKIAEVEIQRRATDKAVGEAQKRSQRVNTTRTVNEIKRASNQLKEQIEHVRREIGNRDILDKKLNDLKTKHGGVIEFFQKLTETNEKHLKRVLERKEHYTLMKKEMGAQIKNAFEAILSLRGYKGFIKIDYRNKQLDLEVTPQNTQERNVNDTKTLSGGERSYSTVAFILALWECTSVPFYFMDEFDVFMDKVNRRIVMDCLLDHAKTHRQCQFGFLTPLDASIVTKDTHLEIYRMENPEREATNQE